MSSLDDAAESARRDASSATTIPRRSSSFCARRAGATACRSFRRRRERVERMLAYCDRDFDEPVAKIPPRYGAATPIRLAANAVMAGCKPEYFPLVMLALEALAEEPYNLYGTQATTHPCTPMLIFNGPVAKEVGLNAGHNVMGNYFRANAAIGRAVRLALVNIGAAIPGTGDMATAGTPAKFTFCVAENEAASPWEPLHVELGFPRGRQHGDGRSRRRARTTSTTTKASPPKAYSRWRRAP